MEILTINLGAAATPVQFRKAGSYFEILSSSGPVGVRFLSVNASQVNSIDGGDSGTYLRCDFGAFDLVNQYGIAQQIKVLVCDAGEDGGSRRQPGTVKVIDQGADKTIAGGQFIQSATQVASAGQGAVLGLIPNGSAKRIVVKAISLQSSIAGTVVMGFGTGGGSAMVSAGQPRSKLSGGAGAECRTVASLIAAASPVAGEVAGLVNQVRVYLPANTPVAVPLTTPLVLVNPYTLFISAEQLNRDISAIFDIEESL